MNKDNKKETIKKEKTNKESKKFEFKFNKSLAQDIGAWTIVILGLLLIAAGIAYGIVQLAFEISDGGATVGVPTLELSWSLLIATLIGLGITFAAIYFLFWDKITKSLDVRRKNVEANISIAKYKAAQAEKNLSVSEDEIKNAKLEGKEIVSESKKEGSQVKKEIIDDAKLESESIMVKSREQIEKEKIQMEDEIRKQILETSILAAEKIIEKEIDADTNKKMIEDLLNELK